MVKIICRYDRERSPRIRHNDLYDARMHAQRIRKNFVILKHDNLCTLLNRVLNIGMSIICRTFDCDKTVAPLNFFRVVLDLSNFNFMSDDHLAIHRLE